MPKPNQLPDPNRRQTRATNANAHPGRVVKEVLAVRRKKEDIEEEKKAHDERCEARERKKTDAKASIMDIAHFEHEMALGDRAEETMFPRRQTEVIAPAKSNKKRKDRAMNFSGNNISQTKKESSKTYQKSSAELDTGFDTEPEDGWHTKSKKQKMSTNGAMPLRRTETYLRSEDLEGDSEAVVDIQMEDPMAVMEIEDYTQPKPKRRVTVESDSGDENLQVESEDDFETPKALRRRIPAIFSDDDSDFAVIKNVDHQEGSEDGSNIQNEEGEYALDNDRQPEKREQHSKPKQNVQQFKIVDFTKVQKSATGKKDRRAFRNEVEEQRVRLASKNQKAATRNHSEESPVSGLKHTARDAIQAPGSYNSESKSHPHNNAQFNVKSRSSATSGSGVGIVPSNQAVKLRNSTTSGSGVGIVQSIHADGKFRNSATSGSGVGIVRSIPSHANGNSAPSRSSNGAGVVRSIRTDGKATSLKSGSNATTETSLNLSDEDDSVERQSVLLSPPKGMKRLSSGAVVKVETADLIENRKSRSKKKILSPDILSGWTNFVEPNFVYFYFYELSPWPKTGDIEACAQTLWDWRFGEAHPLDLAESPAHVQLLNQKLCDIRSQSASAAIGNLDREFQLQLAIKFDDTNFPQDADVIAELRHEHAQDLLNSKKFMFGKYVICQDGTVRKSQPYRSKLILQTFASSFKHIRDIDRDRDDETNGPLPSSRHPKTLLAITTAAVERALELTINNNYDFETSKLIPKPDPSHPRHKPTTSMFAFSEMTWEPRAEFYLEKSILKLNSKEWEGIMNAAAEYSSAMKPSSSKGKGKAKLAVTEEEWDLEYDSDSDV